MAFAINTNLGALKAYNALAKVNSEAQRAQYRLATGKRINSVADDTSGFTVGKSLESKTMIKRSQLNNASAAKDFLSTSENALIQINDLLTKISVKYADAQDPSKSRNSLADDIRSIASEIDSILKTTKFNDTNLLAQADGSTLASSGVFDVGSNFSTDFASDDYLKADVLKTALHGTSAGTIAGPITYSYDGSTLSKNEIVNSGANTNSTVEITYGDGTTESFTMAVNTNETANELAADFRTHINNLKTEDGDAWCGISTSTTNVKLNFGTSYHEIVGQDMIEHDGKGITSLVTTSGFDVASYLGAEHGSLSAGSGGLMDTNTDTVLSAASDVTAIRDNVRSALGRVGNLTQALDYKTDFLTSSITNNLSSISRLFDSDMAIEQLNATKGSIAGSAATSMLSQLNFAPQQLLQLLG